MCEPATIAAITGGTVAATVPVPPVMAQFVDGDHVQTKDAKSNAWRDYCTLETGDVLFQILKHDPDFSALAKAGVWTEIPRVGVVVNANSVEAVDRDFSDSVRRISEAHPTADPFGVRRNSYTHWRVVRENVGVIWSTTSSAARHESVMTEVDFTGGVDIAGS